MSRRRRRMWGRLGFAKSFRRSDGLRAVVAVRGTASHARVGDTWPPEMLNTVRSRKVEQNNADDAGLCDNANERRSNSTRPVRQQQADSERVTRSMHSSRRRKRSSNSMTTHPWAPRILGALRS